MSPKAPLGCLSWVAFEATWHGNPEECLSRKNILHAFSPQWFANVCYVAVTDSKIAIWRLCDWLAFVSVLMSHARHFAELFRKVWCQKRPILSRQDVEAILGYLPPISCWELRSLAVCARALGTDYFLPPLSVSWRSDESVWQPRCNPSGDDLLVAIFTHSFPTWSGRVDGWNGIFPSLGRGEFRQQ